MTNNPLSHFEEIMAYQEKQIQDLSDMVVMQGRQIEALQKEIGAVRSKIQVLEERAAPEEKEPLSITEQARRDKPPHY